MAAGYRDSQTVIEIFQAIFLIHSKSLEPDHPYEWLRVFDEADHSQFIHELVNALYKQDNIDDSDGLTVEAIIHEWHESALAVMSDLHEQAYQSRHSDPNVLLTNPADIREEL